MTTSFIRHRVCTFSVYGAFDCLFTYDSPTPMDGKALLSLLRSALEQAGFTCPSDDDGFAVMLRQVHRFRGEEVDVPYEQEAVEGEEAWLSHLAEGVGQLEADDVLVVTFRYSHNDGSPYDYRLLAVPKGSRLSRGSRWYHRGIFDKDVNWMSGMDSNSECRVRLPEGTRIWNGNDWRPIHCLEYSY